MSDREIIRGDAAQRVLNEPVVQEALKGMREEIVAQWVSCPARDVEAREWVWRHMQVVERFEVFLRGFIETGKLEKMKQQQSLMEKAGDKIRKWAR